MKILNQNISKNELIETALEWLNLLENEKYQKACDFLASKDTKGIFLSEDDDFNIEEDIIDN